MQNAQNVFESLQGHDDLRCMFCTDVIKMLVREFLFWCTMVIPERQVVRAGAPDCAAQPLQRACNPSAQLPQDRRVSHAVATPEFACADPVGVKPSDGLEVVVTEGRVALAELHTGIAKCGADGLHMHAEHCRDLLLRRPVAVGDDDLENEPSQVLCRFYAGSGSRVRAA